MKAAVLVDKEQVEIQDLDIPAVGENELLVKVAYCGICTLEQRLYAGIMKIFYPIVPGHEVSGVIAQVGSKVDTGHQVGDHVAVDLISRCHACHFCRSGSSNFCENRFSRNGKVLSGFSEYIVIKPQQAFVVPSSLPLEHAAFSEPVACCIRSLKKIDVKLAEDVLIIGAGPMGIMHLQVAHAMGARVIVSDINAKRLEDAKQLGADLTVDVSDPEAAMKIIKDATSGRGVSCCVVTTPAKEALQCAVACLADNGRINIYTSYEYKPELPVDLNTLHRKEYLVTGTEGRTEEDFYQAIRLLAFGRIDVSKLISRIVSYDELEEGIQSAMRQDTYRVLLKAEV